MRAPDFVQLYEGVCSLVGQPVQEPEIRKSGLWLLKLPIDEFDVHFLHAPGVDSETAAIVIQFGTIRPEAELQAYTELLDANYSLDGESAPRFSRDPESGAIIFQCAFGLSGASAPELYAHLLEMVQMARSWRQRNSGSKQ
jgi:hypothetical protein